MILGAGLGEYIDDLCFPRPPKANRVSARLHQPRPGARPGGNVHIPAASSALPAAEDVEQVIREK